MTQDQASSDDSAAQARRDIILAEKRNVTSRISDTCRYVGFGLLAVYYTIMSGDGAFATHLRMGWQEWFMHAIGVSGALSILFDYLQYLFGSLSVDEALSNPKAKYNKQSCYYKGRLLFFIMKQIVVGLGASLLVVVVFVAALGR